MPDWAKLKLQGRVKDVGIPWSAAEAEALEAGVPAEYVRRGCMTVEAFEEMQEADQETLEKEGKLPLEAMSHAQLMSEANELGLNVHPEATNEGIASMIEAAREASEEASDDESKDETKPAAKKAAKKATKKVAKKAAKKTAKKTTNKATTK